MVHRIATDAGHNADGGSTMTNPATSAIVDSMRGIQPWVRFSGVLLFISAFLSLLAVIDALTGGNFLTAPHSSSEELMLAVLMGVINIIFECILGYCLFAYAIRIGYFVKNGVVSDLESALNMHRQFWKSSGIYAIVFIVAIVVMMVFVMVLTVAKIGNAG